MGMRIAGGIRMKIFYGILVVTFLSVIGVTLTSYKILKNTLETQNATRLQNTVETLMASLDYAVSHTTVTEENVASILEKEIFKISDVHKRDIVIYDMQGRYLISNKRNYLFDKKQVPQEVLPVLLKENGRYDLTNYDESLRSNVTSSYLRLLNNMLEPVAIVYFPFYHNDGIYAQALRYYVTIMVLANILIIGLGIWFSWYISHTLTKNIRNISGEISKINLNETLSPIKYHRDDEFTPLVNSYNRTLRLIEEQKGLLAFREKESAWREMAKQVAHEVKNPLTPMKLLIQNFERKFDKQDPNIEEKVKKLCVSVVDQIDLIAKVANAFSEFTKLPEKKDEVINLNQEIASIISVFNDKKEISTHFNRDNILINFDKIFFQRIMTNLILNAQQARDENREEHYIDIEVEHYNKKVSIIVRDNGVGIPKNRLDKVFEPNFTTKNSGTGLGLTMVKRMIEEYKGEINIQSKEGKGTEVKVVLMTNI